MNDETQNSSTTEIHCSYYTQSSILLENTELCFKKANKTNRYAGPDGMT